MSPENFRDIKTGFEQNKNCQSQLPQLPAPIVREQEQALKIALGATGLFVGLGVGCLIFHCH